MKEVARLLNEMREAHIISEYALFGATAQMRYTEAVATIDADVLVAVPAPDRLDVMHPIYEFCASRGFHPEGEAIRVGAWPLQIVPVFSELTEEALAEAETEDFDGVPLRVVGAAHLAVIALSVGRAKDLTRVLALLEAESVTPDQVARLAELRGLGDAWESFRKKFLDD
ncbi:MAG: hypothetical protein ACC661_02430 [Verrucomicrobiales bacterium]